MDVKMGGILVTPDIPLEGRWPRLTGGQLVQEWCSACTLLDPGPENLAHMFVHNEATINDSTKAKDMKPGTRSIFLGTREESRAGEGEGRG